MPSVLAIFLALLVPVVALLFLNLRFARKLDYPHHLLDGANRPGPAAFLFRSFRTYYDILIDAFIALVLALAMAGQLGLLQDLPFRPRKEAVVIDCSASMLLGRNGSRPLDLALAWVDKAAAAGEKGPGRTGDREGGYGSREAKDRAAGSASSGKPALFALAFDPSRGQSRLVRLDSLIRGASVDVAVTRVIENLSFLGLDYGVITRLRKEGFGRITLLTDSLAPDIVGIEMVRLGGQSLVDRSPEDMAKPAPAASGSIMGAGSENVFSVWPASIRFDREKGNWLASFVQSLPPSSIGLDYWDDVHGIFARLDPGSYQIETREYGWAFRILRPGIYRATAMGPSGEGPLDFTFRLVEERRAGLASGPFSTAMMSVFPLIEKAPRPSVLFLDRTDASGEEARRQDAIARDRTAQSPGAMTIETRLLNQDGTDYLPPAMTGGRPILAKAEYHDRNQAGDRPRGGSDSQGWSFELGPGALANPDLPLAYNGALLAVSPPAFLVAPQGGGRGTDPDPVMSGNGSSARALPLKGMIAKGRHLFVKDEYGLLPVNPPSSEYFPAATMAPGTELAIAAPSTPVALWAALLGFAALAKLLIWKKLGGKRRRPLDT
jgi:hypothetical protein